MCGIQDRNLRAGQRLRLIDAKRRDLRCAEPRNAGRAERGDLAYGRDAKAAVERPVIAEDPIAAICAVPR